MLYKPDLQLISHNFWIHNYLRTNCIFNFYSILGQNKPSFDVLRRQFNRENSHQQAHLLVDISPQLRTVLTLQN